MTIDGYSDFSLIGAGGNAKVYRAECGATDEFVAIKILFCGGDESVSRRFERERSSMAVLDPLENVVPVHESGTTSTGDPYLVMPLFSGGSLKERIDDEPIPWREALAIGHKVANAVSEAHEMGILHLDIKPGNVLLDEEGEPYLADFGIAETIGSTASMSAQLMTPAYTPPERFDGSKPTEQTDVYGLGGLLFALITGRAPFVMSEYSSPAAMIKGVVCDGVSIDHLHSHCPAPVVDLVSRTLSKSQQERPATAADLRDEIAKILENELDRAVDPILPFRVSSESAQRVSESPQRVEEIVSTGGERVDGLELLGDRPVQLDNAAGTSRNASVPRASSPVTIGTSSIRVGNSPAVWAAAAALFLAACIAGTVSATIWNSQDPGGFFSNDASPVLDELLTPEERNADSVETSQAVATDPDPQADVANVVVEVLDTSASPSTEDTNTDDSSGADGVTATDTSPLDEVSVGTNPGDLDDEGEPDLAGSPDSTPGPALAAIDEPTLTVDEPVTQVPDDTTGPITTPVPGEKVEEPEVEEPEPTVVTTTTTTTVAPEPAAESLEFEDRIDIGDISETSVSFRFTTSASTNYQVVLTSSAGDTFTQNGSAVAGLIEGVTVDGLTSATDYTIAVTLLGDDPVSASPVLFRTAGDVVATPTEAVQLLNLQLVSNDTTEFELNYESNICANGSFVIRDLNGTVVGSNSGQADGCTTRHLAVPGFWTASLAPNTTYEITVTVEANGQGLGQGNTASQTMQVTTAS